MSATSNLNDNIVKLDVYINLSFLKTHTLVLITLILDPA